VTLSISYDHRTKISTYFLHYLPEGLSERSDLGVVEAALRRWRNHSRYGEQLSFSVVSVRRVYECADWYLTLKGRELSKGREFQAVDIYTAFPSMTPQVLHDRATKGYIPFSKEPAGKGHPRLFGLDELIQAGVIHELAQLGLLLSKHLKGRIFTTIRDKKALSAISTKGIFEAINPDK
jgi:hypothetical protein